MGLTGLPLTVMIIAASLPIGANVFMFSQRYEVAHELVTVAVAVSTVMGLDTCRYQMGTSSTLSRRKLVRLGYDF